MGDKFRLECDFCHTERSEESCCSDKGRFFVPINNIGAQNDGCLFRAGKCDVKAAGSEAGRHIGEICRRGALPSAISDCAVP